MYGATQIYHSVTGWHCTGSIDLMMFHNQIIMC